MTYYVLVVFFLLNGEPIVETEIMASNLKCNMSAAIRLEAIANNLRAESAHYICLKVEAGQSA